MSSSSSPRAGSRSPRPNRSWRPWTNAWRRGPATEEPVERDHSGGVSRTIRLEVSEGGRVAVKVRLPASIGDLGLEGLPGFTRTTVDRIRAAVRAGAHGAVFESIDDDGDGVRIVLE